jgi:hypothetical protein
MSVTSQAKGSVQLGKARSKSSVPHHTNLWALAPVAARGVLASARKSNRFAWKTLTPEFFSSHNLSHKVLLRNDLRLNVLPN